MKYPRTFHLPDSPGATADDRIQHDLSWLDGELVVTEKMDGGNLTFTRDTAVFSARTMSARLSPTIDLKRTSMPNKPSSSVINNELLSVRPPSRSSEPTVMISAMKG